MSLELERIKNIPKEKFDKFPQDLLDFAEKNNKNIELPNINSLMGQAIALMSYNKNSYFYNGCIYLTDGLAAEPIIKPRCKVFWVISPNGEVGPHLKYGRVVKIHN